MLQILMRLETHGSSNTRAGGPRIVVETAAFHARVRGSFSGLGDLKDTKCFFFIHL